MSGRIAAVAARRRRRQDHALRRRGLRRRVEVARRRHHLQAGLRQAAGAVDRRHRARSDEPEDRLGRHRRGVDAQLGLDRRRHLQVHRRRRDLDQHGPAGLGAHHPHPRRTRKNGDIVYACVPGKLWSDSADRGLYKTTDGGKTWSLVLKGANLSTGCSGLALDPAEPRRAVRRACGTSAARAGRSAPAATGPTRRAAAACSASTDGGKTWTRARRRQRTRACRRRRGAASRSSIAPSDAEDRLRASSSRSARRCSAPTTAARPGRSATAARSMVWRPFYFARLVVDPTNPDRLFKPDLRPDRQRGRRQELRRRGGGAHGDWHDLWIDPTNPKHVIGGDDGGLWISLRRRQPLVEGEQPARSRSSIMSASTTRTPTRSTAACRTTAPGSATRAYPGGITNARWENLYGGDGFWAFVRSDRSRTPSTPRRRAATSAASTAARYAARDIQPKAGYKEKLRFNWNTPIARQPNAEGHDLHRRAVPVPLARPRRHLGAHLARSDHQRSGEAEAGAVGRHHRRQLVGRDAHHHLLDQRVAEGRERHLGRHRRRQPPAHARRRARPGPTWSATCPACRKASGSAGSRPAASTPATAYAAVRPPHLRRHDAVGLQDHRLRQDLDADRRPRRRACAATRTSIKEDTVKPTLLFLGTEFGCGSRSTAARAGREFKGGDFPERRGARSRRSSRATTTW